VCEDAAPTGHTFEERVCGALLLSSPSSKRRRDLRREYATVRVISGAGGREQLAPVQELFTTHPFLETQVSARARCVGFGTGRAVHVFGAGAGLR
jgi:hypothetical protein